ncbi:MAG: beta-hexosaminidase [Rickettsiales bacterium]|jgi:beta-N-acetylhexosaminidase|nr:beta-hexosaminidase [Rickettsiales bacterium]
MANAINATILGFSGMSLTPDEKSFFKEVNPLGFILFARNCESKPQVKALVDSLKSLVGHEDVPILIDQEGGRVARLKPPVWRKSPAAGSLAAIAAKDLPLAKDLIYKNSRLMGAELRALGINVDCAPVVDLLIPGAHDIVGDRAFGETPQAVAELAREAAKGLLDEGVQPIIKHIPGHGRAKVDSHESLPVVDAGVDVLRRQDFEAFRLLADMPWAMTAHIVYTAFDSLHPATHSPRVIEIIRKEIGFDGMLVSDDLSMKALRGSFGERAKRAADAGCDVMLHCNGDRREMEAIVKETPSLSGASQVRVHRAFAMAKPKSSIDFIATNEWIEGVLEKKVA